MTRRWRQRCECRLTVLGSQRDTQAFRNSAWDAILRLRHPELVETSPCRFVCQFETEAPALHRLQRLSKLHPQLVLLLDYEAHRLKGLAKAKAGALEHCEVGY